MSMQQFEFFRQDWISSILEVQWDLGCFLSRATFRLFPHTKQFETFSFLLIVSPTSTNRFFLLNNKSSEWLISNSGSTLGFSSASIFSCVQNTPTSLLLDTHHLTFVHIFPHFWPTSRHALVLHKFPLWLDGNKRYPCECGSREQIWLRHRCI